MKYLRRSYVVHGFALLHLATAYISASATIGDSRLLTIMTILMTLIICVRERLTMGATCICFVLVNIVGYYLGMGILMDMEKWVTHELLSPTNQALSSFLTTEALGWGLFALIHLSGDTFRIEAGEEGGYWDRRFQGLILFVAILFGLRLFISTQVQNDLFGEDNMYAAFQGFILNYSLIILIIVAFAACLRFLVILRARKWQKGIIVLLLYAALTILGALAHAHGLPFGFRGDVSRLELHRQLMVSSVVCLALLGIVFTVVYALNAAKEARMERTEANKAIFQYENLKQQVNPHFLFNSLNVLDGLVLDEKNEEASEYIHKLCGVYRYMLRHDSDKLVSLQTELDYVRLYVDLLLVRFPRGLEVEVDIPEDDLGLKVVPCAVQMLVENAVKHNAIIEEDPLRVGISSDGKILSVVNNVNPKKSKLESHHLGQTYIRQQYKDRGSNIRIESDDKSYRVELPLL